MIYIIVQSIKTIYRYVLTAVFWRNISFWQWQLRMLKILHAVQTYMTSGIDRDTLHTPPVTGQRF